MATNVLTFKPSDRIEHAIDVLVQRGFSGAPVVEDGRVVGVLSELDCMKLLAANSFHQEAAAMSVTVSDLMSANVISIEPDTDLFAIAHTFIKSGVRRLPVLEGERLVGLVSRPDLLRAMREFVS
jgi:CBS domain-containing protein